MLKVPTRDDPVSITVISFGANCYPEQLPYGGRWICWDKRVSERADEMLGSPFELAWTNRKTGFDRMYRVQHGGAKNDGANGVRVHPTEKPLSLMRRIIVDYTKPGDLIFDGFGGSGTAVAAQREGRRCLLVELDAKYAEIAKQRVREAKGGGAVALRHEPPTGGLFGGGR